MINVPSWPPYTGRSHFSRHQHRRGAKCFRSFGFAEPIQRLRGGMRRWWMMNSGGGGSSSSSSSRLHSFTDLHHPPNINDRSAHTDSRFVSIYFMPNEPMQTHLAVFSGTPARLSLQSLACSALGLPASRLASPFTSCFFLDREGGSQKATLVVLLNP